MKRFSIAGLVVSVAGLVALSSVAATDAGAAYPTSVNTASLGSSACQATLASFINEATANTYTSTSDTVAFPNPLTLANPATVGDTASPEHLKVPFVAYGADGTPVAPGRSDPLVVSIFGAPAGAFTTTPAGSGSSPYVMTITGGSSFSLEYSGVFLWRPPTITATMQLTGTNVCTGTRGFALGSTSIQLNSRPTALGTTSYSTPANCHGATTGAACSVQNINKSGLALKAAAGYGAGMPGLSGAPAEVAPPKLASFTVDTGSIGTVVPVVHLGPDAIGPGAPALKYYDSSGNEFAGYVYLAPVTFSMGSATAVTDPIRILAVVESACHPAKPCTKAPPFENFYYLGVGFDRSQSNPADPFQSPCDNALLSIEPPAGKTMSQGYILSGSTITAGITKTDSARANYVKLQPNTAVPGDWLAAPVEVSFPTSADPAPSPICGVMLMDVGVSEMFITFSSSSAEPPVVSKGLVPNQEISIATPCVGPPALQYQFSSGPVAGGKSPPATGMAPSWVGLGALPGTNTVFVNTGRHVLFDNDYVFNAQTGQMGFIPISPPLR